MTNNWQPIETQPLDGRKVLFWSPLGGCFIAPSSPNDMSAEEARKAHKKIYESDGTWPNVGWNPTHWQPIPQPPEE